MLNNVVLPMINAKVEGFTLFLPPHTHPCLGGLLDIHLHTPFHNGKAIVKATLKVCLSNEVTGKASKDSL